MANPYRTYFVALWLAVGSSMIHVHASTTTATSAENNTTTAACSNGTCADPESDTTTAPGPSGFLYRCTGTRAEWDGITYVTVGQNNTVYWGPCGYPNPHRLPQECGQDSQNPNATYACDPDGVLNAGDSTSMVINNTREDLSAVALQASEAMDYVTCTPLGQDPYEQKIQIVVALARYIRTVDMNGTNVCQDSCGQVVPYLSPPQSRDVTPGESRMSANTFPQVLRSLWKVGDCDNDIVVFFVEEYGMITGSVGLAISQKISSDALARLFAEGESMYAESGGDDPYAALEYVVMEIAARYGASPVTRDSGPAYMLLIILAALMLLFLLGFGLTYHYGRVSDYWGEQWWETMIRYILFIAFGIFIIKGILYGLVTLQEKAKPWWLAIPIAGVIVCSVAAVIIELSL